MAAESSEKPPSKQHHRAAVHTSAGADCEDNQCEPASKEAVAEEIAFAKHHWLREAATDTDICFRLRSGEVPCIPNPVIAPHWAEKSSVFVSYYHGYFRSFLT